MSHCGQCGMYEAIITATPIVTIPLFTDQRANAVSLQHLGVGVNLELKTVTKDAVLTALYTIINDSRWVTIIEYTRLLRGPTQTHIVPTTERLLFIVITGDRKSCRTLLRIDL